MSAPAEIIVQGATPLLSIVDEPTGSPTIKIAKLTRKPMRDKDPVVNTNKTILRMKYLNPRLEMDFEGQLNALSGLAVQDFGTKCSAVANFTAAYRGYDPSVGTIVLEDPDDSLENINDAPTTKGKWVHYPYVITA